MQICLILISVCFAGAVAVPSPSRVIGGEPASLETYSSTVQIESRNIVTWSQTCAGTILTARWIVSAAQCFGAYSVGYRRVRAGATARETGGHVIDVERIINHPDYRAWNFQNDINLSYLAESLVYNNYIQPTTIFEQGTTFPDSTIVTVVGWGNINGNGENPDTLQKGDVLIINRSVCQTRYSAHPMHWLFDFTITDAMICSGYLDVNDKDACPGDEGGPLYYQNFLVGIVSWGSGCGDGLYPRVNVNVAHFTNWIVANSL